jgi:hypothetical protein
MNEAETRAEHIDPAREMSRQGRVSSGEFAAEPAREPSSGAGRADRNHLCGSSCPSRGSQWPGGGETAMISNGPDSLERPSSRC